MNTVHMKYRVGDASTIYEASVPAQSLDDGIAFIQKAVQSQLVQEAIVTLAEFTADSEIMQK